jgi:hypothetical protein
MPSFMDERLEDVVLSMMLHLHLHEQAQSPHDQEDHDQEEHDQEEHDQEESEQKEHDNEESEQEEHDQEEHDQEEHDQEEHEQDDVTSESSIEEGEVRIPRTIVPHLASHISISSEEPLSVPPELASSQHSDTITSTTTMANALLRHTSNLTTLLSRTREMMETLAHAQPTSPSLSATIGLVAETELDMPRPAQRSMSETDVFDQRWRSRTRATDFLISRRRWLPLDLHGNTAFSSDDDDNNEQDEVPAAAMAHENLLPQEFEREEEAAAAVSPSLAGASRTALPTVSQPQASSNSTTVSGHINLRFPPQLPHVAPLTGLNPMRIVPMPSIVTTAPLPPTHSVSSLLGPSSLAREMQLVLDRARTAQCTWITHQLPMIYASFGTEVEDCCCVCLEPPSAAVPLVLLPCSHTMCRCCATKWIEHCYAARPASIGGGGAGTLCAVCRRSFQDMMIAGAGAHCRVAAVPRAVGAPLRGFGQALDGSTDIFKCATWLFNCVPQLLGQTVHHPLLSARCVRVNHVACEVSACPASPSSWPHAVRDAASASGAGMPPVPPRILWMGISPPLPLDPSAAMLLPPQCLPFVMRSGTLLCSDPRSIFFHAPSEPHRNIISLLDLQKRVGDVLLTGTPATPLR